MGIQKKLCFLHPVFFHQELTHSEIFLIRSRFLGWLYIILSNLFYFSFRFYTNGVLSITIGLIGIIVNIAGIAFMAKKRLKIAFHKLMIFLAVWDLCILILIIYCISLPVVHKSMMESVVYKVLFKYGLPLIHICMTGSIYSTLVLTIDRWVYRLTSMCIVKNRLRDWPLQCK